MKQYEIRDEGYEENGEIYTAKCYSLESLAKRTITDLWQEEYFYQHPALLVLPDFVEASNRVCDYEDFEREFQNGGNHALMKEAKTLSLKYQQEAFDIALQYIKGELTLYNEFLLYDQRKAIIYEVE